jgi:uncharacterized protein
MSLRQKIDYNDIVKDIMNNNEFLLLDKEAHHGISRLAHSIRVAKTTYKVTKFLHLDYIKSTRAALLHDFFRNEEVGDNADSTERLCKHPLIAVKNAKKYYEIGTLEENIISSHMFPLNPTRPPKYAESYVVSFADKSVATYEMYRFKFNTLVNVALLFIFNIITIQK